MICKIVLWSGVYHLWAYGSSKSMFFHQGRINFEEIIAKSLIISPFTLHIYWLELSSVFNRNIQNSNPPLPLYLLNSQQNSEEIIIKSVKWEVKERVKTGGFCICAEQSRVVLMGHL